MAFGIHVGGGGPTWVELHPKWEVDNFCCSHRCTSDVHLVRDALVLVTPARPATSANSCFDAPPCGEAFSGTARLCIALALQSRLRSNIESANRRFPA
jgi:hypothetical protein